MRNAYSKTSRPWKLVLPADMPSERTPVVDEGSLHFIGNATVVMRYGGYTFLTDPNFAHKGEHLHVGYGLTTKRLVEPAIQIDQLPRLDFVLVSHLHADHFDHVALRRLNKIIPIITTPKAARALAQKGFHATHGLETWETMEIGKQGALPLRITAMPGRHGPAGVARLLPPVMGSLLEFGDSEPFRVYFSGDTLIHPEFHEIPRRVPTIDLALLHLGGTRILGVYVTMNASEGLKALKILRPKMAIPIHYNDYTLFKSSLDEFQEVVRRAGLENNVRYLFHGDKFHFRFRTPEGFQPVEPVLAYTNA